jgi:hypothetical protein
VSLFEILQIGSSPYIIRTLTRVDAMEVDTVLELRKCTDFSIGLHHTVGHEKNIQHAQRTYRTWYHEIDTRDS